LETTAKNWWLGAGTPDVKTATAERKNSAVASVHRQAIAMAGIVREFMRFAEPAPRTGGHRPSLRAAPRAHELTDLTARLPPELAFLAGEGFSPERLLNAIGAEPRAVRPLDKLLSEGHISEEAYYRALARHLGCRYYDGDPPLAAAFDAVRGLSCGVAPLELHGEGPRAVIAPRAQFVPRLIEMAQSSRYRSGSFALASPQRFAGLLRARRSEELLDVALGRLPARLTARHGMTRLQFAALGALAVLASLLGAENFTALEAVASAALWLTFAAMILLRSMAVVAGKGEVRPPALADAELPDYTIVVALYREKRVVRDLIRALDGLDYPGIMAHPPQENDGALPPDGRMAEIRTVTTLRSKRVEILASISLYEKRLAQARADLAHVTACITIFEASVDGEDVSSYVDTHRMFARGEMIRLCKDALASGPRTTKELALHVMASKGLDTGDKVLAHAMAQRMIHALRQQWRRGQLQDGGKVSGARVWDIPR
jgi:hypothetical protein